MAYKPDVTNGVLTTECPYDAGQKMLIRIRDILVASEAVYVDQSDYQTRHPCVCLVLRDQKIQPLIKEPPDLFLAWFAENANSY